MNSKSFVVIIFMIGAMVFTGCKTTKPLSVSETNYYGADLTEFPPQVREWIMNVAFTRENMEKKTMKNPQLKVWWSSDNNKVLAEAVYVVADGYVGAGKTKSMGNGSFEGDPKIFSVFGKYADYQTLKYKWELKQRVDKLLLNDAAYAEVIGFAKQLCSEIEYDWANFKGYKGPAKATPGLKHAVCDGYANEVMDKVLNLSCVQSVQKWVSNGHAWNVLKLTDGRTLYMDLTWFDNEHIDKKTGKVFQTDDYNWANITFDEELFRFSNVGYGGKVFHHNIGKLADEKTK